MKISWFHDCSIRQKIFNYLILAVLLPFLLLGFIQSRISTKEVEKILMQNTQQMLDQVNMMLDFYMREMENSICVIEEHPAVIDFITGQTHDTTETMIRDFFQVFKQRYPEIAGILILGNDDHYISNEIYRLSKDRLVEENWYVKAMENPDQFYLTSKPLGRNLGTNANYGADEIMSIVKATKNPKTGQYEGVILIDFKLSALDENICNIILGSEGFLYVMDHEGSIIYAPYNPIIHRIDNTYILDNKEKSIAKIHGELYQIVCLDTTLNNWKIVGVFPISDVMSVVNMLRYVTGGIFVCTVILAYVFSKRCDKTLIVPLNRLQGLMNQAENGNLDVQFKVKFKDEIGALGNSFNRMICEINRLLKIVEQENKLKREAEFQVLQEQIKPHFLYNTLDTINWMAIEYGANDIVKLVTALTNLFRISLSKGKEYITLEDEINHVKNYLIIQETRYEDSFKYEIQMASSITEYQVIKLLLQPLVENSIYHGIKESKNMGSIVISAREENGVLVLSVKDNGVGIPSERVRQINQMFACGEKTVGYGLFNVNQRLKYTFGTGYGLKVESEAGKGTTVFVYHPIIKEALYEDLDC